MGGSFSEKGFNNENIVNVFVAIINTVNNMTAISHR